MKEYNHKKIESKWQEEWKKTEIYKTLEASSKPKAYILDMFPYPSGEGLHVGHPKGYIATDVYSRFKTMNGFNVLHPMGWDAFGLPAENYAIKNKVHPRVAVDKNIARYEEQLSILGFNYDWSREINTTDPKYYKWTQWIFLKMLEKGLAFQSFEPINWCPSCMTGLANEDLEDGKCERCGSVVEKKPLRQWVLRITDYADRLLSDIDALDWPESIKESQRNWIGRSEGAEIKFKISNSKFSNKEIVVFTTRPDTLFGVSYVVLAPEHKLLDELKNTIANWEEVQKYITESKNKPEIDRTAAKEKTGIKLEGVFVVNPINGEEVPVFVADYVLGSYGTGAVMAVPAHDERDFEFAKKYNLPIKEVIMPYVIDHTNPPREGKKSKTRRTVHAVVYDPATCKYLTLKWKQFPWNTVVLGGVEEGESLVDAAMREIKEETGYTDVEFKKILGSPVQAAYFAAHKDENRVAVTSGLYFELKSHAQTERAQEEIDAHDIVWRDAKNFVPEKMTNSELPFWIERMEKGDIAYTGDGVLVNSGPFDGKLSHEVMKEITEAAGGRITTKYKLKDWVFSRQRYWGEPIPVIHCDKCGPVGVPEKDLPVELPNVKHYEPTGTGESPLASIEEWVNVDCPKCGGKGKRETNTMPQWAGSSWYHLRYIDPHNDTALVDKEKEKYWSPVDFYVGGAEHATRHLIYARFWHKFLFDIGVVSRSEPFSRLKNQGLIAGPDGRKMSKRYGNIINPDDVVAQYGADTLRVYEMFIGPFEQGSAWSTESIIGPRRFIERIWKLGAKVGEGTVSSKVYSKIHKTTKKVGTDIESFSFNTALSALMILLNELEKEPVITSDVYAHVLKLVAPFAPHVTDELWHNIGHSESIHKSQWPTIDEAYLKDDVVTIAVQINGKVRSSIEVSIETSEEEVKGMVFLKDEVKKWIDGKDVKKVIYVRGRILNIVV